MWRSGPTEAERLAAAILRLEGYRDIEPQAPLGGPDGRKDILCHRGGLRWVGAVYFPSTTKDFEDVKEKFHHDLEGVKRHGRQGLIFLTNQRLKISEREALVAAALDQKSECMIYDVERIRAVLDVPEGYGVRIAFLGIPMELDEQLAFFARRENAVESAVDRNTAELRRLAAQVAGLQASQRVVAQTMISVATLGGLSEPLPLRTVDPLALGDVTAEPSVGCVSVSLNAELILLVHRLVGFELPSRMVGRYRSEPVHLGAPGSSPAQAVHQPPDASQVPTMITDLCDRWKVGFGNLNTDNERLTAVASFHHEFLVIHPFLDGNGRVARALLLQQCIDLFGRADMSRFDRGALYNTALTAADAGDLKPLEDLIRPVVFD